MTPESVEIIKDVIKIGLPGLIGLLAGLVPYLIERKKFQTEEKLEIMRARRELILNFTESLSSYIGSSNAYINCQLSLSGKYDDHIVSLTKETSSLMVKHEIDRVKAKSLCGVVGNIELIDALIAYDNAITEQMNYLATRTIIDDKESDFYTSQKYEKEKELLIMLNVLS